MSIATMKPTAKRGALLSAVAPSLLTLSLLALPPGTDALAQGSAATVPEAETSDVMTAAPPQKGWFYVNGGWWQLGTSIFDAQSGKMKGMVATSRNADLAFDPSGKYYYVAETIWSKGNRGTRQDMVSVYDTTEMKLKAEIAIPDRIIIGDRKQNFIVSADGKWGFIYNLSPASSVNIVDLTKRKFAKTVEVPGCAALIPNPGVGFSALCSDGSMATISLAGARPQITRSAAFFSATGDPVFENFGYDKAKNEAVLLSYSGLVYTAKMGATPSISEPFSLQGAAGYGPASTKPLEPAWYPGTRQPMALHKPSGHLFVLMHMGEYWSHKAPGTEIWELDVAAKKVVRRIVLAKPAGHIEVTQDAAPMLFVNNEEGTGLIIDPKTGEEKYKIEHAGGGIISVVDPS
ncbi:MAG TPA: amine dehydrogenase large subunit [Sphingobium sp.]|uniref:amine dehydrogenase large subunit n=1 Tax=Sphingobium sp. TaxID=1912891 RepID=UPI002ED32E92